MRYLALVLLLSACASSSDYVSGSPLFRWPLRKGTMTRGFIQSSKKHDGIDLAAKKNTPIYAAEKGRVLYVGREFSGYGKLIIIEHQGDRWASFYGHLNGFKVSEGDWVKRGQLIGLVGKTGRATGYHLHFEIRHNLRPVDPLRFLPRHNLLSKY